MESNRNFQTWFPLQKIKHLATPVPLSLDWLNLCLQAVRFNLELAGPSGTSICAPEDTPRWESNWVASAFQNCSWVQFNVNNLYRNLKRKSVPCRWQLSIESCPRICTMICPMRYAIVHIFSDTYQKSSLLSDIRLQFAVSTDTNWFVISRSKCRVERRVDWSKDFLLFF